MPVHQISNFVSAFQGGTRPNRFRITGYANGNAPYDLFGGTDGIYAMASSIPESTVGTIPIPYRGRIYKYPGDRDYQPWQVTFLDDIGAKGNLHKVWHEWSNSFNNHVLNVGTVRKADGMFATLFVQMLDHNSDNVIRTFELSNAWPMQVGPIELNMTKVNENSTFTCQIAYTHYVAKWSDPAVPQPTTGGGTQNSTPSGTSP